MTIKVGYTGFVHSVPTSFVPCEVVNVDDLQQQITVKLQSGEVLTVAPELFAPVYVHKEDRKS